MQTSDEAPEAIGDTRPPKKRKKGKERGERAAETLLRTSYRLHTDLSGMADSKANIMISINGLIISVVLAAIAPRIGSNPYLLLPTAVVLTGCLVSLAFAVIAARPRITPPRTTTPGHPNLLFFGSFRSLAAAEYEARLLELMRDPERLHREMAQNLHALGEVLHRKFSLIRVAYTAFLVGLAVGVVLYCAVYALTGAR